MKNAIVTSKDIIVDNGSGIYILTQDERRVSRKQFNGWLKDNVIYFERCQWGVEHYMVFDKEVTL